MATKITMKNNGSIRVKGEFELFDLSGKKFEPNKELTRAEVAEMLSKTPWGRSKIKGLLEGE